MGLPRKKLERIGMFLSRGCEYAGTQETVNEIKAEVLDGMGFGYPADEVGLEWDGQPIGTLDDFADDFWDRAVERFLNVLSTE